MSEQHPIDDFVLYETVKKSELEERNRHIYNNSLVGVPTGAILEEENVYEILGNGHLVVKGIDGTPHVVAQGTGLGVRQHDDVMLAAGYSRKVRKKFSLDAGDYALIILTLPANINHHVEGRSITAYNSEVEIAVVPNYLGTHPVAVETLTTWNQRGATIDPSPLSVFTYHGTQGTNPLDIVPDDTNAIDGGILRATTGQGQRLSTADGFADIQGRYYYEGKQAVWFYNSGSGTAEVTYKYRWHEFV